jgi:hypothetical protein
MVLHGPGVSQEPLPRRPLSSGLWAEIFEWQLMGDGMSYSIPQDVAIMSFRPDVFLIPPSGACVSSRSLGFLPSIECLSPQNSLSVEYHVPRQQILSNGHAVPLSQWAVGKTTPVHCGLVPWFSD